jgi:hypothetical protein
MGASGPTGIIKDFPKWLLRMGNWLWQPLPRSVFWALMPLVLAAAAIHFFSGTECAFRLVGMVLQILGIGSVIVGIETTRRLFAHPTLWSVISQWWAARPRLGRLTVTASLQISPTISFGGKASAFKTHHPPAGASVEQRLESLEANVEITDERISGVEQGIDKLERKQFEGLRHERNARAMADDELRTRLVGLATGGFHISLMGAVWLFAGVILSTAAPELSRWCG